jgi:hypothetical protein
MQKHQYFFAALLLAACGAAAAQDLAQTPPLDPAQDEPQTVEVKELRNPELRSYRNIMAGMDAFEEHHALAPAAPELRFRLKPKRGQPPLVSREALSVRISGNGAPIVVPVAADATFTLPRIQSALDENADVILNRKKGLIEGVPQVRTPGLPDNVRRLGDIRLECEVLTVIGKREMGFLLKATISTFMMSGNWCAQKKAQFWFSAAQPVESAVIREGGREAEVKVQKWSFLPPVGDQSWSNDALIELHFAAPAEGKETPAGQQPGQQAST